MIFDLTNKNFIHLGAMCSESFVAKWVIAIGIMERSTLTLSISNRFNSSGEIVE